MYADMLDTIGFVAESDPQVARAMQGELCRQRQNIELIASENVVSPAVLAAMGSVLTNKYAEGYPGHRYYGGCAWVDEVENIARERACRLFGAQHANVQPHSGAQANLAVYFALLNVGDTVLGMDLSNGGHLTHGSPVNMSGKNYRFVPYGVDENGYLDYEDLARKAREHLPKLRKRTARCIWWIWLTLRGLWPRAFTPALCRMRTLSPPPRTKRCAARAAA